MDNLRYLDFELQIAKADDRYSVVVLRSPAGESSGSFELPFNDDRIENLILRMGALRRGTRSVSAGELAAARELGAGLFDSVFDGEVLACLRRSLDLTQSQESVGLRLKLGLQDVPELANLPWEFLYDRALNRFLAQSGYTPLVRYVDLPQSVRPLRTTPPLRLLVMASSPEDPAYPQLDIGSERRQLEAALEPLVESGRVQIDWLERATLGELQRRLRGNQYHVFHYIGHGAFDEASQESVLILENDQRRGERVAAHRIGPLLHDHRSLRLAVLNSCEGARSSRTDPFASMAASLIQQGIPATIAMQFEISDDAAIIFSADFYSALAMGYPVDASVAEARKSVMTQVNNLEWGTPVLYMRSDDGVLFDLDAPSIAPPPQPAVAPMSPRDSALQPPRLRLEPVSSGGFLRSWIGSRFKLTIDNPNPTGIDLRLAAGSEEDGGAFSLPEHVSVAANGSAQVPVRVYAKRGRWSGARRSRSFSISATGSDGLPPTAVTGSYADEPRAWWPIAGGVLGIAAAAVLASQFLLGNDTHPPDVPMVNRIVFASDHEGSEQVYTMNTDGSEIARLTSPPGTSSQPAPALYGDRIGFISDREGSPELYAMNPDGTGLARVLTTDGTKSNPNLTADGNQILFEIHHGPEESAIYVVDIDGRNLVNLTGSSGAQNRDPSWSADHDYVVFSSNRSGNFDIWVMETDGSNPRQLTTDPAQDTDPIWSADGNYIAFTSNRSGRQQIWVMDSDGGRQTQVTRGLGDNTEPGWSQDVGEIVFTSNRDGRSQIYLVDVDGSRERRISQTDGVSRKPSWFMLPVPLTPTPPQLPGR